MKVTFNEEEVQMAAAAAMHKVVGDYDVVEKATEVFIQRKEPGGPVISFELQLDSNELDEVLKETAEKTFEGAEVKSIEYRRTKGGVVADIELKTKEG